MNDTKKTFYRGKYSEISFVVAKDITDYKIRVEIYDGEGNSIELANTAAGGGDSQIEITATGATSYFTVKVAKNLTADFDLKHAYIEIEFEAEADKPITAYQGSIRMRDAEIDWLTPT